MLEDKLIVWAHLALKAPEDGGWKSPITTGYRPSVWFPLANVRTDVSFMTKNDEWIEPKAQIIEVELRFYFPNNARVPLMANERDFFVCEGKRVIASGVITEVTSGQSYLEKQTTLELV